MRARAAAAAAGLLGAALARAAPPSFEVRAGPRAEVLAVEARFTEPFEGPLVLADGGERFVRDVQIESAGGWKTIAGRESGLDVPGCARGCRVRYRFLLREAAEALGDPEAAAAFSGSYVAPPSSWLLHSASQSVAGYQLRVTVPEGIQFLSGLSRSPGLEANTFRVTGAGLRVAPMCAFGAWRVRILDVGGAHLTIGIAPVTFAMSDPEIEGWIQEAVAAVAAYYRGFPVKDLLVLVTPSRGGRLGGVTLGEGGASVLLRLGTAMPARVARSHWVLTHELMHLGFPSLLRRHIWMEEGMAVFGEPIVRVRAGMVDEDELWSEWLEQGAIGLPRPGEGGLEETHTWARTYWGGALFWLLADVTLRERTANARSVDDVLRALVAAGGNVNVRWTVEDVLRVADAAAGTPVISELFRTMAEAPGAPDLPALWKRLGIALDGDRVVYDDRAPLAAVRRAMAGHPPAEVPKDFSHGSPSAVPATPPDDRPAHGTPTSR
ncbi:MAG TPA: hypothetical protein VK454_00460 [Myxococcaceae bacterium]|nr:hypothetical protein [Myxococcaceae bacterium]